MPFRAITIGPFTLTCAGDRYIRQLPRDFKYKFGEISVCLADLRREFELPKRAPKQIWFTMYPASTLEYGDVYWHQLVYRCNAYPVGVVNEDAEFIALPIRFATLIHDTLMKLPEWEFGHFYAKLEYSV